MSPPNSPPQMPDFRHQIVHLVGVSAFVVALPLLDVVRRNSEFLVAHRATAREIAGLLVAIVLLVPAVPLTAAGLAGLLHQRLRDVIVGLTLFALLALQGLRHAAAVPTALVLGVALSAALCLTTVYWLSRTAQSFASYLVVAALAAPALFGRRGRARVRERTLC